MSSQVISTIQSIRFLAQKMISEGKGQLLGEDAWCFSDKGGGGDGPIDLTILAIIHGDEVGGLGVVLALLEDLSKGSKPKNFSIALALGNVEAASMSTGPQRYIKDDLNRGFGRATFDSNEHKRAKFLESILARTSWLIDLHQTVRVCPQPFFIFPYSSAGGAFARIIEPSLPIVTHWGKPFSKEGMCTDAFVNLSGGVGITIELGQMGWDQAFIETGVQACRRAIDLLSKSSKEQIVKSFKRGNENNLYTWAYVLEYKSGDRMLPGFNNFRLVHKGEEIAIGVNGSILSPGEGYMLFAYEPRPWHKKEPAELCRLMKNISGHDLPKS